ncbi:MAG: alpha-L-fucosidase [Clostridiales bacterium]|nr:alpha-L-fucosidase [Clostridiales bacterium]
MDNWFKNARFGMFIHYGPYSVAARGEWAYNRERIGAEEYFEKYAKNFKAENCHPKEWARLAKDAGVKYTALTARHHDGFCLWGTKTTDFNAVACGPRKDLVAEYLAAVREAGLKAGLYYSVADWRHPDYPGAYSRDWPLAWEGEDKRKRFVAFYTEQIRELMTNYGQIDVFWFDGCFPQPLDGEKAIAMIRSLQPGIMINNRNGRPYDFLNSEQAVVPARDGGMWEAGLTLNDSWGYNAGDDNYKSARDVVKLLLQTAQDGGNLTINVSPAGDGAIPERAAATLREVGEWLRINGEAVYGSERSPFSWGHSHIITVKGERVYINLHKKMTELCVAEIKNPVKRVCLLKNGADCQFSQTAGGQLTISGLPETDDLALTIVCETEGKPEPLVPQTTFWIPGAEEMK